MELPAGALIFSAKIPLSTPTDLIFLKISPSSHISMDSCIIHSRPYLFPASISAYPTRHLPSHPRPRSPILTSPSSDNIPSPLTLPQISTATTWQHKPSLFLVVYKVPDLVHFHRSIKKIVVLFQAPLLFLINYVFQRIKFALVPDIHYLSLPG